MTTHTLKTADTERLEVAAQVLKDINELHKLRVYSKIKAIKMISYVHANIAEIVEYRENGMKISEITELVSQLS